jgi:glycosyltransferase involved in cell wall biosynthesis
VPVPGLSPGKFVLAVGEVSARKNVALLVAVWRDLVRRKADRGVKLVVAGIVHTAGTPLVREVGDDPELANAVCFLPNAGDGELRWLYANCRFTAFPSRLEGFGLPVAESLAFGKVCVASNAAAVPEASQGSGIHLHPDDMQAWTQTIEQLIGDDEALRRAEQAIAERYVAVSWEDTAEDVLAAIEAVVPKASPMEVAPR